MLLAYCCIVLPAVTIAGARRPHFLFLLVALCPIAIMSLVVWPFLVGSPPGADQKDFWGAVGFATNTVLRLAVIGGAFQAAMLTLNAADFSLTLRGWGIKGDWLLILLGGRVCAPEFAKRADKVLTASIARGQLKNRGLVARVTCLLGSILPITTWALQSAISRAEVWDDRKVVDKINELEQVARPRMSLWGVGSLLVVLAWFLIALGVRFGYLEVQLMWLSLILAFLAVISTALVSPVHRNRNEEDENVFREPLGCAVNASNKTFYKGPNFSGRTERIRESLNEVVDNEVVAYIGPDTNESFSGLSDSLRNELKLSGGRLPFELRKRLRSLLDRDLDSLSGGESAFAAIGVAMACNPKSIGVDCALEQLDFEGRAEVLKLLASFPQPVHITDNRMSEWNAEDYGLITEVLFPSSTSNRFSVLTGEISTLQKTAAIDVILDQVCFSYPGSNPVLRGINVKLEAGHVYHLSGKNGVGKSTLAKLLVGAIRPDTGTFKLSGTLEADSSDVFWKSPGKIFSYHFQNPNSQLFKTSISAEILESSVSGEANARASEWLECFGLKPIMSAHPHDQPFAMRKRVALAATFARGTPWIILDEPTLGQDDYSCERLIALIQNLSQQGVGFILISHSAWFMSQLDSIPLVLESGVVNE